MGNHRPRWSTSSCTDRLIVTTSADVMEYESVHISSRCSVCLQCWKPNSHWYSYLFPWNEAFWGCSWKSCGLAEAGLATSSPDSRLDSPPGISHVPIIDVWWCFRKNGGTPQITKKNLDYVGIFILKLMLLGILHVKTPPCADGCWTWISCKFGNSTRLSREDQLPAELFQPQSIESTTLSHLGDVSVEFSYPSWWGKLSTKPCPNWGLLLFGMFLKDHSTYGLQGVPFLGWFFVHWVYHITANLGYPAKLRSGSLVDIPIQPTTD